jgi:hypothetical protein
MAFSTLTELTSAERAYSKLTGMGEDVSHILLPDIIASIPDALALLAKRVKGMDSYRTLQVKQTLAAVIVNGVADLSTAPFNNLLFDITRSKLVVANITSPLGQPVPITFHATPMPYTKAVYGRLPADQIWVAHSNTQLLFRYTDGQVNTLNADLTITASYIPILGDATFGLPHEHEDAYIKTLVEVVMGGFQKDLQALTEEAREASKVGRL